MSFQIPSPLVSNSLRDLRRVSCDQKRATAYPRVKVSLPFRSVPALARTV
jgi:hypothetical protein